LPFSPATTKKKQKHFKKTENKHLICKRYQNHQFSKFTQKFPGKINVLNLWTWK